MAQLVKNLPTMQETWVQSLGWEDLLEKGMATHSSILAWRIPWTVGSQRVGPTERLSLSSEGWLEFCSSYHPLQNNKMVAKPACFAFHCQQVG